MLVNSSFAKIRDYLGAVLEGVIAMAIVKEYEDAFLPRFQEPGHHPAFGRSFPTQIPG